MARSGVISRVLSLAILVVALVDGAAHAQPWAGAAGFGVEVNDRGGRPVAGVSVVLAYLGTPGNGPELTTDADGRAEHGGLAEGMWVISVRHPQFLGYDAELRLDAGRKPFEERAAQVKTSDSTERLKIRFYSVAGSPESRRSQNPPAGAEAESQRAEDAQRAEQSQRAEEARREQQEAARQAQADQAEAMRRQREAENAARDQARAAQQEAKRLEREEREQREAERAAESAKRRAPEPAPPPEPETTTEPAAPAQAPTPRASATASVPRPASDPPAVTPAPAPPQPAPSPAPTQPPTSSRAAPSATPPIVDRTTAPPLPLRSPLLRTSRDGTCRECRPNEWSVTAAGEPRAAGPPACPESLRPLVVAMGQRLAAAPAGDFTSNHAGAWLAPADVAEGLPDVSDLARDTAAGGCQVLALKLPRDAKFLGFQLEIEGATGVLPCIPDQDCPGNVGRWATLPVVEDTPSGKVVGAAFRHAGGATARPRLTVYFLPPEGWSP